MVIQYRRRRGGRGRGLGLRGGGSLVIFWCWVDFGAGLVGRWNFGTLSIFRCLLIFLVLSGFWCWVGRSVDARGVLGLCRVFSVW